MTSPQLSPLERSILAVLAYHDIFEYPLTVEEIWKWLYVEYAWDTEDVARATPVDVERALSSGPLAELTDRAGSFVSLKGRSVNVATRMERKVANERKWRRAKRVSGILRFVPFVRFIGVVNTLALDNARPESDIDLFIIVKRRRLWLTRAVVTALVHLMGVRRHGSRVADNICLSFYVSDGALNLESLQHPAIERDTYLHYWITQVVPMFSRNGCWNRFLSANKWVAERIPHGFRGAPVPYHNDDVFVKIVRFIPEALGYSVLGDIGEWLASDLQYDHMLAKQGSRIHDETTDVVVTDDVLKFHERDRREEYQLEFQKRMSGLTI
ncbi:MAG: hypothetical protein V1907_03710 [Candidatus Kerfeldbacteria bacterium]